MTHHNINLLIISLVRKNRYVLYHLYYSYIVFNVVDGFIPIRVLEVDNADPSKWFCIFYFSCSTTR